MSELITVPFSHLVLRHREIGVHRGRRWGFRDVFGFATLRDVPFVTLASKVKDAYEGRNVPFHCGWPDQREALRWLVEKGNDGIYALDEQGIRLMTRRPGERRQRGRAADASSVAIGELGITPMDISSNLRVERSSSPTNVSGPLGERDVRTEDVSGSLGERDVRIEGSSSLVEAITLSDRISFEEWTDPAPAPDRYYISDGHHRALALYVLGAAEVRARVLGADEERETDKT